MSSTLTQRGSTSGRLYRMELSLTHKVRNCLLLSSAHFDLNSKQMAHSSSKINSTHNLSGALTQFPSYLWVDSISITYTSQKLSSVLLFSLFSPCSLCSLPSPVYSLANFQGISQVSGLWYWGLLYDFSIIMESAVPIAS